MVKDLLERIGASRARRNILVAHCSHSAFDTLYNDKRLWLVLIAIGALLPFGVNAITAPTSGSFAYDLYDIGVNDILKGAPGFVGGIFGIVYSATKMSSDWKLAGMGVLASSAVLKADSITTSLGALV
ncbi:MAG: hypothetical protein ACI9FJ_000647 [Alteromonadaceae bacterium]|jgi:hypothetical protein